MDAVVLSEFGKEVKHKHIDLPTELVSPLTRLFISSPSSLACRFGTAMMKSHALQRIRGFYRLLLSCSCQPLWTSSLAVHKHRRRHMTSDADRHILCISSREPTHVLMKTPGGLTEHSTTHTYPSHRRRQRFSSRCTRPA